MRERRQYEVRHLTVEISADEHRALKCLAAEAGTTLRELVVSSLRREGLITRAMQRSPIPAR